MNEMIISWPRHFGKTTMMKLLKENQNHGENYMSKEIIAAAERLKHLLENEKEMTERDAIENLIKEAHDTATSKGWHDKPTCCKAKYFALMHSEISEAMEEDREDKPMIYNDDHGKPCGMAIELADAIIRIFDMCGEYKIDLYEAIKIKMAYNKTRPHKHGGKAY